MKFLTTCCAFLALFATAQVQAAPQGFIEGHLKIIFRTAVDPGDMPEREVVPESYTAYPLVILTKDGRKEVARLTADAHGNYRAALPPGDYLLDVPDQVANHILATSRPFTVVSNQTVRVDITVFSGVYKGQVSTATYPR
jgi:hypothetical protein